jgi:hypothetical protein
MLGFELDFWDYATFATAAAAGISVILIYIWIAGLPGRIAIARNHPDAEAVKLMGWAGLLPTVLPWIQAFIWAFKPTDIVDIRRFPKEEALAIDEDIARLKDDPRKHGKHANAAAETPDRNVPLPPSPLDDGTKPGSA